MGVVVFIRRLEGGGFDDLSQDFIASQHVRKDVSLNLDLETGGDQVQELVKFLLLVQSGLRE